MYCFTEAENIKKTNFKKEKKGKEKEEERKEGGMKGRKREIIG